MSSIEQNGRDWMRSIKGFLLDITGVLYNSSPTGGCVIPGSVEAVQKFIFFNIKFKINFFRLYSESKVRFVSNESTSMRKKLIEKLNKLGFELYEKDIFTPAPVAATYVTKLKLRPHLLVHKGNYL